MQQQQLKKLAVWKFASCDGCQLSLLDCEDELLLLAERIKISHFLEVSTEVVKGPYDLSLVEGSISTETHLQQIIEIRRASETLVTIGACASAGGIQALRNFTDVAEFTRVVYAQPEYVKTLEKSTAVGDHVAVDFELRGCPVNKMQLLEVIVAFLRGRRPQIPNESVCVECKASGVACLAVAEQKPCMGPVTQAGCGAICPRFGRGCYGCFGPKETANVGSLLHDWQDRKGVGTNEAKRLLHTFNAWADGFRDACS